MVLKEAVTHTPGPWKADRGVDFDPTRCFVVQAVDGQPPFMIAEIENGAPGDCLETEMANARLIAAAPDLLAALKKTRQQAFMAMQRAGTDREFALIAVAEADAAIAKAEGAK